MRKRAGCKSLTFRSQLDIYPRENTSMLLMPELNIWSSNRYVENEYQVFGTVLYDAVSGKAIWSAVSDTLISRSDKKALESYVRTMLKKMEGQGLISPERR